MKGIRYFWGKSRLILIMFSYLIFLSGCWSSRELDELGIAVALGIDKTEEGTYSLTVQIINPSEIAAEKATTRPPVTLYKAEGETLFEAIRKMTKKAPRKIYFSQLRLLILGQSLAEEGVLPALDLLYRDAEFRTSFFMTIAKNASVEDILSVITPYEKIPANKIMDTITAAQENWAATEGVYIDQVISDIRSTGKSPVMTGILLNGSEDTGNSIKNIESPDAPTRLEIDHLSVFKDDRMLGWLNEAESKGYNYIVGNVKNTLINFPCKEEGSGKIGVEILRSNAAIDAKLKKGKPVISVEIEAEGNVGEVECQIDLSKPETLQMIEQKTEGDIKDKMQLSVKAAQEVYKSDIFGFGNAINRKEPNYWKKVEKEWNAHFVETDVEFDVKVNIRRKGTNVQPVQKEG
ncbi:spore germination protein KC [Thalassobacillus cyri]|uniref:Spore germination protein KC n=1 Tax=Thalassobacillus cyri TaxID=571932 RepID=A0A1H4HGA9_9BACI|nr:Ger(x)C family spore germination protein [Thalassobacillus cyri]SEB20666.1 spore germination protein KC [Thalassobacillus cyri]